jgi:excisionase family DNA binding protein
VSRVRGPDREGEALVTELRIDLPPELVERLAERAAELVLARLSEEAAGSPWLTVDEAAEYARLSTRTLERLLARGRLRSASVGRRRLLHRDELDRYLQAATREDVAPTTPPRRRRRTLDATGEEA